MAIGPNVCGKSMLLSALARLLAPSGITVAQLVARGRFPHQAMFAQHGAEDDVSVCETWVATTLAQQAPIMLLDEPTTFLDVAHQVDLLDLFAAQRRQGHTVVAVLHDINQAIRYADTVVLLERGRIVAHGDPRQVITAQNLGAVFGVDCEIRPDPVTGGPMMLTVPAAE